MKPDSQSAATLQGKVTSKVQTITKNIINTATTVLWTISDKYEDVAPLAEIKLREIAVRVQTKIQESLRMRRAAPYAAGTLAVLLLTAAPASAVVLLSQPQQVNGGYYETSYVEAYFNAPTTTLRRTTSVAPAAVVRQMPAEALYPTAFEDTEKDELSLPLAYGLPVVAEEEYYSEPVTVVIEYSEIDTPEQDTFEFVETDITAADFELSAIVKPEMAQEPIVRTTGIPGRGTVISFGETLVQLYNSADSDSEVSTDSTGTFIWPAEGRLTSLFGFRDTTFGSPRHLGIDINSRQGSPIFAVDGGEVIFSGWNGAFGLKVKIRHDNGQVTLYSHCSELLVDVGERVHQGQVIALMGRTGRATGVHLHFEVFVNGVNVDPLLHLPRVTRQ